MKHISIILAGIIMSIIVNAQKPGAFTGSYPETKKSIQADEFFETRVEDPYRWLEDDMSPETKEWVQLQNNVTESYLSKIPLRDSFKQRLSLLWNYEKYSLPFTEGEYTYYLKNTGLQNQSVLYRQKKGY